MTSTSSLLRIGGVLAVAIAVLSTPTPASADRSVSSSAKSHSGGVKLAALERFFDGGQKRKSRKRGRKRRRGGKSQVSQACLPSVLKARLGTIRRRFGPIRVVSTRSPRSDKSYHPSCKAVDFIPPRGKYRAVANWLKKNHAGGVGTYSCAMHHIHIDTGAKVRWHKCIKG